MSEGLTESVATESGTLNCRRQTGGNRVHRVGYTPMPWAWTPWEFAENGRFTGRWDDPDGNWRTVYSGDTVLACLLEVLAFARHDPRTSDGLDQIDEDPRDAAEYPTTVASGELPQNWCTPRMRTTATIEGCYVAPGDAESLPTLRERFLTTALRLGLDDVDAAAVRDSRPRELTQAMAAWFYELTAENGEPVAGVHFQSRHGDGLGLWAIFERPGDEPVSARVHVLAREPLSPRDAELAEAMRIHRLTWQTE
ncbi:RES domain-containing protein [Tomitella gaofuii]|uniref:RES domain-containing protein n=1 Tax=Tomitella gaofuii TaxID=2760083 RepID=UPI0015FD6AD6|nr:RES domain-containing protein [Tomitella gaofuii]